MLPICGSYGIWPKVAMTFGRSRPKVGNLPTAETKRTRKHYTSTSPHYTSLLSALKPKPDFGRSLIMSVCLFVRSITREQSVTWYREWPWDILEMMWFWGKKVKVTGSVSAFFTLMNITLMLMHIWLTTAIWRGFELYEFPYLTKECIWWDERIWIKRFARLTPQ